MKNTILWIGALVVGTINMNGCAAFILVTSLFVMQQGGTPLTLGTIVLWTFVSVISAVGNAGPYALADDRHRSTRRRDGHHPAHLHHHRHGGDRRERVVRLLRLRYDRSRYKMRKYAILIIAVR